MLETGEEGQREIATAGCEVSGWARMSETRATRFSTPPLHEASLSQSEIDPADIPTGRRVAAMALCKNRLTHLLEDACSPNQYKYLH